MDRRLLDLYNRELAYLRAMGAEFAKEFPKIAGRLGGLDEFQPCQDPFVERLIEGFAFLAARVQLKLSAEFPRFTQSLLETVYPHYLAPTPSMCIVQFEPDLNEGDLSDGFVIHRGSSLYSKLGKTDQTRCEYCTAHDVTLWPIKINQANYYTRELASFEVPNLHGVTAGIKIEIQSTAGLNFSELKLDSLILHLMGVGEIPMHLYEQFFANAVAVVVQPATKPIKWQKVLDASCIRRVGFDQEQQLLPYDSRSFQGYRLLHEYFAFPQRFMFIELAGLGAAIRSCDQNQLDIIILFRESNIELEGAVNADNFGLFCSPAINLFKKRLDRILVSDKVFEFHVVPDRTKAQDFEVYKLSKVIGYGALADQLQEFLPFYLAKDLGGISTETYYVTNRVPRSQSQDARLQGRRSRSYAGSEVYISLVDSTAAPYSNELKQLGVEALCTNRDLPLHMPIGIGKSDFTMEKTAPCTSIRCLGAPTLPKPSHAEGEIAWRIINHLSLNYLSLTDTDEGEGASALRDLLRLYSDVGDLQIRKQIDGVKSISCKPITRRIATSGSIAFARGLEVTVTLEEAVFEGTGVFLLGAVLEQFFAKYISINSFTETVVKSLERGEIMRWKMRDGLRPIL
ncbi:MAG: type VI secretion system baseplate subunit TssF [Planctomycetes bacterium]|nr:type VI secretion system baseplate subunit TssF [Planctomycetota bacterium]MBL7142745.1 type VI secretion system baseplate subunit TssF [Phycisphaerae bacterium]